MTKARRRSSIAALAFWIAVATSGCATGLGEEVKAKTERTPDSGTASDAATPEDSTGASDVFSPRPDSPAAADSAADAPEASGDDASDAASSDVASDALGPCQTPTGPCVNALPTDWTLALFEPDRVSACPSSYTARDAVTAQVGAGACDCACTVGASPSCTTGQMATRFGTTSTCASTGASINVNGSACTMLAGNVSSYFSATPLPAVVTCSASPVVDATKLTPTEVRTCEVPSACREDVCNGNVPAGFSACVARDGDVPCPPGWETRTLIGDSAQLSCSACTCQASASCTGGRLSFFSDPGCSTLFGAFDVNDTCQSTNGGGMIRAFSYSATVADAQCTADGARTAAVQLTAARTVCCK